MLKKSDKMTRIPKCLLFLFQNALFTSIVLLIFQSLNYTSQNEFMHLIKKNKNVI